MRSDQKKRLKEVLKKLIRECLKEQSVTGTGGSFSGGSGEQYATPKAFGKSKGAKESEKEGWKKVPENLRFKAKTFDVEKWKKGDH